MKKLLAFLLPLALTLSLTACGPRDEREDENVQYSAKPVIYLYPEEAQDEVCDAKPVAYLYPQTETEVTVRLDYDGKLTCTYPAYADGWTVSARPDGTLTDKNGQTYRYLYWEGISETEYDFTSGFWCAGKRHSGISGGCAGETRPEPHGGQRVYRLLAAADAGKRL